jgi:DNA transposition AAA+ family ATPase
MIKFIQTKQYKQFAEFCKACERDYYIGLCYGPAGVGKTESARRYTKWYPFMKYYKTNIHINELPPPFSMKNLHTALYTPSQLTKPKETYQQINELKWNFGIIKEKSLFKPPIPLEERNQHQAKLIIIDEAERLKPQAFELIREMYDTGDTNFIFIGMPGIEKTIAWYPQLYSRVGFIHQFKNMGKQELKFIFEKHLNKLNYSFKEDDYTDQEVIAAVLRITHGNFRLVDRIIKQAIRIMKVNCVTTLTKEIIEAARSCLLIGQT